VHTVQVTTQQPPSWAVQKETYNMKAPPRIAAAPPIRSAGCMTSAEAPPVEVEVGGNFSNPFVIVAGTRFADTPVIVVVISAVAVKLVVPFTAL